jgi:excisionase family DNA binding protein
MKGKTAMRRTRIEKLVRVGEVAEKTGLSSFTVRQMVKRGQLCAIKIGRQYRLRLSDVVKALDAMTINKGSEQDPEEPEK